MREFFRKLSGGIRPQEVRLPNAVDASREQADTSQNSLLSTYVQEIEAGLSAEAVERARIEKERLSAENEFLADFEKVVVPAISNAEAAFESKVPPEVIALCEELGRKIEGRVEGAKFKKKITFILKYSESTRFDEHEHKKGEDIVDPRNSSSNAIKKRFIEFYRKNGSIPIKRMIISYSSGIPAHYPNPEAAYFSFELPILQEAVNGVFPSQEKTVEYVQGLARRFAEIFVERRYIKYITSRAEPPPASGA